MVFYNRTGQKKWYKEKKETRDILMYKITPLGVSDGNSFNLSPGGMLLRGVQVTQVRKGKGQ